MTSIEDYAGSIDVEVVVSCTSDGLVVILRRARLFHAKHPWSTNISLRERPLRLP
jgi:hypothetical protein